MRVGALGGPVAVVALAACVLAARPGALADDGAAAAAPALPSAENAAFKAEADAAAAPFLPELEKLGEWCNVATLIARRACVAEALILLAPDNERGRTWLRFKRQADGTWRQTSAKPFFDDKPETLPEWEKRRAPLAARMRAALEPLIERRDDWRTAGVRARLLRALVAIDPGDAELHARAGEVLAGKKWILKESAATADGRRRIRDAAGAASKDAVAEAAAMKQGAWRGGTALGTPELTVQSTIAPAETRDVAIRVVAARRLYERVFDVHTRLVPGFAVSVFPNHDAAMAYVDTLRDVSPERHRFAEHCVTFWVSGREVVVCAEEPDRRTDECVRQVLSAQQCTAQELMRAPAWIGEGVGMYLTYALVGTRLTPFINVTKYADDSLRKEVADPQTDWVQAIRKQVVEKFNPPRLRTLTSLPLNSMSPDDTLMAYALAAYFLEGRPNDLHRILESVKTGADFHRALADNCDIDADELEARFERWLRETK